MEEKNLFDDISDVGNVALDTYETVNAEDLLNMLCAPFVGAEQQDFTLQVLPSEEREGDPTAEFSNLENSEGTLISDEINFLLGQVVDDFGCPETLDKEQNLFLDEEMGGPEPGTVDMKACSEQGPVNIMLACSEKSTFEIGPQDSPLVLKLKQKLALNKQMQNILVEKLSILDEVQKRNHIKRQLLELEIEELRKKQGGKKANKSKIMGEFLIPYPYFGQEFLELENQNTDSRWMRITGLDVIARSTFEYTLKGDDDANEIRNAVLTTLRKMKESELQKIVDRRQNNYDELKKQSEECEKNLKRKVGVSESLAKRTREARKKLLSAKERMEKTKNVEDQELLGDGTNWKELNWNEVRDCLEGKPQANYSANQLCWLWNQRIHQKANVKRGPWSKKETNRFRALLKKPIVKKLRYDRNWEEISKLLANDCKDLNDGVLIYRSKFDLISQFMKKLNWYHRKHRWTNEESEDFLSFVNSELDKLPDRNSELLNWDYISRRYPGRTKSQMYFHWFRSNKVTVELLVEMKPKSSNPSQSKKSGGRRTKVLSSLDQEICQLVSPLRLIRKGPAKKNSYLVDGSRSALGLGMLHFSLGCHLNTLNMPRPELSDKELEEMGIPTSGTAHYRIFYHILKKLEGNPTTSEQQPIEQYPPVESCLKPTIATLAGYKGLLNWNKGRLETLSQAASKATQAMSMMSLDEIEHDTDVEMKGPGNKDAQDLLLWRLRLLFHRSALALKENMGRDENVEERAPPMKYAAMEIPNEPLNQGHPRRASHTAGSSPGPSSDSGTPARRGRGGGKMV